MDARTFVVNRARVVEFNGVVVAISKVFTVSSFISQAPHDDGGVVEVAFHQSVYAINEGGYPTFEVGDALVSVVFEVSFVAGVQTIVVVHRIHARIVGIVRGANGVDVVLLHQQDVAEHRFVRHRATKFGIGVLTVYSLQQDALSVNIEQRTLKFYFAEANFCTPSHLFCTVTIALHEAHGVELRSFSRPQGNIVEIEIEGVLAKSGISVCISREL